MDHHLITDGTSLDSDDMPLADRRAAIAHHMTALEELTDTGVRRDGWTPFARKLFLRTLAETGRVTTACDYTALSKQSAYALRARDPLFAAGWDAACELARMPLADALYEAALDGLTDTITRDDGRTATRHRFDSRLSIAVLSRLDRRCDRSAEQGSRHLGAVSHWEEYTAAIGADDQPAAVAILDAEQRRQPSQLRDDVDEDDEGKEDTARLWWDEDRDEWRTNFPPPADFDGNQRGKPGDIGYNRTLSAEELDLTDRDCAAEDAADCAADATLRDTYFAQIRSGLSGNHHEAVGVPAQVGPRSAADGIADAGPDSDVNSSPPS